MPAVFFKASGSRNWHAGGQSTRAYREGAQSTEEKSYSKNNTPIVKNGKKREKPSCRAATWRRRGKNSLTIFWAKPMKSREALKLKPEHYRELNRKHGGGNGLLCGIPECAACFEQEGWT
jgi:hypothetical protein